MINPKHFLTTYLISLISLLTCNSALADTLPSPPVNEITFTLTAQEWAKTDTAKVTVGVHAALDKKTLGKMREQIMSNLNKIAKGDWHITTFNRSQDSSGLEKLYVVAEARVNEALLTNVNSEAENVSESGMKYEVRSIDFTPSVADIEKVRKALRDTIYHQAQAEIMALNTTYPQQKYALHSIHFGDVISTSQPQMMMVTGAGVRTQNNAMVNTVSNLVTLTAEVDIASEGLPVITEKI